MRFTSLSIFFSLLLGLTGCGDDDSIFLDASTDSAVDTLPSVDALPDFDGDTEPDPISLDVLSADYSFAGGSGSWSVEISSLLPPTGAEVRLTAPNGDRIGAPLEEPTSASVVYFLRTDLLGRALGEVTIAEAVVPLTGDITVASDLGPDGQLSATIERFVDALRINIHGDLDFVERCLASESCDGGLQRASFLDEAEIGQLRASVRGEYGYTFDTAEARQDGTYLVEVLGQRDAILGSRAIPAVGAPSFVRVYPSDDGFDVLYRQRSGAESPGGFEANRNGSMQTIELDTFALEQRSFAGDSINNALRVQLYGDEDGTLALLQQCGDGNDLCELPVQDCDSAQCTILLNDAGETLTFSVEVGDRGVVQSKLALRGPIAADIDQIRVFDQRESAEGALVEEVAFNSEWDFYRGSVPFELAGSAATFELKLVQPGGVTLDAVMGRLGEISGRARARLPESIRRGRDHAGLFPPILEAVSEPLPNRRLLEMWTTTDSVWLIAESVDPADEIVVAPVLSARESGSALPFLAARREVARLVFEAPIAAGNTLHLSESAEPIEFGDRLIELPSPAGADLEVFLDPRPSIIGEDPHVELIVQGEVEEIEASGITAWSRPRIGDTEMRFVARQVGFVYDVDVEQPPSLPVEFEASLPYPGGSADFYIEAPFGGTTTSFDGSYIPGESGGTLLFAFESRSDLTGFDAGIQVQDATGSPVRNIGFEPNFGEQFFAGFSTVTREMPEEILFSVNLFDAAGALTQASGVGAPGGGWFELEGVDGLEHWARVDIQPGATPEVWISEVSRTGLPPTTFVAFSIENADTREVLDSGVQLSTGELVAGVTWSLDVPTPLGGRVEMFSGADTASGPRFSTRVIQDSRTAVRSLRSANRRDRLRLVPHLEKSMR